MKKIKIASMILMMVSITSLAACDKKPDSLTPSDHNPPVSGTIPSTPFDSTSPITPSTPLENRVIVDESIKDKNFDTNVPAGWTIQGTLNPYANGIVALPKAKPTDAEHVLFTYTPTTELKADKIYVSIYSYTNTLDTTRQAEVLVHVNSGDQSISSDPKFTTNISDADGLPVTEKNPEALLEFAIETKPLTKIDSIVIELTPCATRTPFGNIIIEKVID